jgi:outer membrane scaffolding protein for murein synthesis (MipA/OmpV family)
MGAVNEWSGMESNRRMHRMRKMMTVGLVVAMAAGVVSAQDEVVIVDQTVVVVEEASVEVTVETALMSAYVWRGQVLNSGFVTQPQATISKGDFSFNVWGNYDLEENVNGNDNEFSELDLTLAYSLPVDLNQMAFDVGLISYSFQNNGDADDSTWELFGSATCLSWDWVIPSLTLFTDIDNGDGVYGLLDVVFPYEVSEYLTIEGGVSMGYGSTSYNDYYWDNSEDFESSDKDAGINDYNVYFNASYEITEDLTASLNLTYTTLEGGSIKDAGDDLYEDDDQFWGGLGIAYDL